MAENRVPEVQGVVGGWSPTAQPSFELTMKIELRMYDPGGGVIVFHDPPVKWRMTGHGAVLQLAVALLPPPTTQTSPLFTMKTELRLFVVPMATPFVQTNPFQW